VTEGVTVQNLPFQSRVWSRVTFAGCEKKEKQNVWQIFLAKNRNKFLTDILRKLFGRTF
jgi:hypothetical protein